MEKQSIINIEYIVEMKKDGFKIYKEKLNLIRLFLKNNYIILLYII